METSRSTIPSAAQSSALKRTIGHEQCTSPRITDTLRQKAGRARVWRQTNGGIATTHLEATLGDHHICTECHAYAAAECSLNSTDNRLVRVAQLFHPGIEQIDDVT